MGVKDRPAQLGANKWSELGKTVEIMLRIFEPIFGIGKYVIIDNFLYVEKRITVLEKKDVYDGAIIKNHKYWPKGIPGDEIDRNFHNRDVGGVGVLEAIT